MTPATESPRAFKYRAFLSYSHEDRRWARWLMRRLERYRVPRRLVGTEGAHGPLPRSLAPVFRDREELPSGADLGSHVSAALEQSEAMILIASPAAARSHWVNEEVRRFRELGREDRILAFVVAGEPGELDGPQRCFPPALIHDLGPDGEPVGAPREPIAADAREAGDGRKRALGKLVAGLLGIGFGDLEQRELQRRQQRLVAITTASLAGLILTGGLAVSAHLAREDADRRRAQAEGLLGFMVGDLRDSLEPIGRLDLLEKVGDEAMAYFSTVQPGDLSDEGLARQAQTLTQIGEIRLSQARYDEALDSFEEALERSRTLAERNPDNGDRLFDRGQAEFWVGYVPYLANDPAEARRWFTAYLDTSRSLVDLDPAREDWRIELAYAQHNLATLELRDGNVARAAEVFDELVETWAALDCDDPACDDIKFDLADAYTWQGLAALRQGRLADFEGAISRARNTYAALRRSQPDNRQFDAEYADETNDLARAAYWLGKEDAALELSAEAVALRRALAEHDPTNRAWADDLLMALADRAEYALAFGRLAIGQELLEELNRRRDGLRTGDGDTEGSRRAAARALLLDAEHLEADAAPALERLRRARQLLGEVDVDVTRLQLAIDAAEARLCRRQESQDCEACAVESILSALEKRMVDDLDPRFTATWVRLATDESLVAELSGERRALLTSVRGTGLRIPGLWPEPIEQPRKENAP
jgi:hypothetical protein